MDEILPIPQVRHPEDHSSIRPNLRSRDRDRASTNPGESDAGYVVAFDREDDDAPERNSFAFTPNQIHSLLKSRSVVALDAVGGVLGLAAGLRTDVAGGLSADETELDGTVTFEDAVLAGQEERPARTTELPPAPAAPLEPVVRPLRRSDSYGTNFSDRRRIFGVNRLPQRKQKSFWKLMWIAFNDSLLILLTISAAISLAIGIYQSVDTQPGSSNIEYVDGITILVAVIVIVVATAFTDWQKEHKFAKLNERKSERDITVIRSGKAQLISVHEVMVGDLLHVEAGEVIPVDGILVETISFHVDESTISGECGLVHKGAPGQDLGADPFLQPDPFVFSGTRVSRGVGRVLVAAIGVHSTYSRTLMSLREDVQVTPLQAKLGRLGKQLIIFGAVLGVVFFAILFIQYLVNLKSLPDSVGPSGKAERFFNILTLSITVVVIAVPEGLALNVTIALAFATKRMLKDNNLVRLIRSCEVMGHATCICSDKTGTLTENKMTVVTGRVGLDSRFDDIERAVQPPAEYTYRRDPEKPARSTKFASSMSAEIRRLLIDSMALNSTAFEGDESADCAFIGSSTETALLKFTREHMGMGVLREERANCQVVTMLPFDSARKWMAVLVRLDNGRYRLFVKGAAEVVLEYCAFFIPDPSSGLQTARLTQHDRDGYRNTIEDYATKMLRPVAVACMDFDESQVLENSDDNLADVNLEWLASGMIFVGVFGIRDPVRPGAVEAVRKCQDAGVFVRMVTGDNFSLASAMAAECGIYTAGGIAMDGPTFRKLSPTQLDAVIPRLQVLARSSPEDKLLLVTHLKKMNETVAVTGDGTNDALALKAADVGFAMGVQGTEVAKEAASIILLDDNFTSIVKALNWGRTVIDAVKKFCQFQFTINITAGTLTVVSELAGDSIFTVVQLLWINLIMDIFASMGLATDHPSPDFLKRRPERRDAHIVSLTMWKMILGQSIYQLTVVLAIHYTGWNMFEPNTESEVETLQTVVFNMYVWMQFFNQLNCRRVDNKIDILYQGIWRNPWFIGGQCITILGQFLIIYEGGEAFDTRPLTGPQWGWTLLFGFLTIPLGALIRQIPDVAVLYFFRALYRVWLFCTAPFRYLWSQFKALRPRKPAIDLEILGSTESVALQSGQPGAPLAATRSMISSSGGTESKTLEPSAQSVSPSGQTEPTHTSAEPKINLDLVGIVEAAKEGRQTGKHLLEIHPLTSKRDPILVHLSPNVPPSQDPYVQQYMPKIRLDRRQTSGLSRSDDPRQQQRHEEEQRSGWNWDRFLRSKRW